MVFLTAGFEMQFRNVGDMVNILSDIGSAVSEYNNSVQVSVILLHSRLDMAVGGS